MRVRCLSMSGRRWCARDANAMSGEKNKKRLRKREKFRGQRAHGRTYEYIDLKWPDLRQLNVSGDKLPMYQSNLMRGLSIHRYVSMLRNGCVAGLYINGSMATVFRVRMRAMTSTSVASTIDERDEEDRATKLFFKQISKRLSSLSIVTHNLWALKYRKKKKNK